jgi:hypothetical protein
MAAFNDLLDLRTAVIEHVRNADIADVFPRLVAMAESRLNRTLRLRDQITDAPVTITAGRGPLPADFAEALGLFRADGLEYVQQSPQHRDRHNQYYSIQGSEIVAPLIEGDVTLSYYAVLPPLSAITSTNLMLARYPDLYLYAVGFEAAKYIRDTELAVQTKTLMDDAYYMARADDEAARYSRARVRVAGCNP